MNRTPSEQRVYRIDVRHINLTYPSMVIATSVQLILSIYFTTPVFPGWWLPLVILFQIEAVILCYHYIHSYYDPERMPYKLNIVVFLITLSLGIVCFYRLFNYSVGDDRSVLLIHGTISLAQSLVSYRLKSTIDLVIVI